MRIRRVRPEGLVHWEIWDFRVGGHPLYECPERLWEVATRLRQDAEFDGVFLGGGRAIPLPNPRPFPIEVSPDGAFVGERGGFDFLGRPGAVVDVGQSAIKVSADGRRRFARDLAELPIRPPDEDDHDVEDQRRKSRAFLARALESVRGARALVVALPCEIDDRGVPGRCSYVGWEGDADLVPDAIRLAGVNAEVFLMTDAELAGLSAPRMGRKTLVLTAGYAIGACLKL